MLCALCTIFEYSATQKKMPLFIHSNNKTKVGEIEKKKRTESHETIDIFFGGIHISD